MRVGGTGQSTIHCSVRLHAKLLLARRLAGKQNSKMSPPPYVSLSLPSFTMEGIEVPACNIKVKSSINTHDTVSVELSAASLAYIKRAMLQSVADRDDTSKGICWRKDRQVWLARKTLGSGRKSKSFKPRSGSKEAKAEARLAAERWCESAAADDGESDDDGAQS